MKVKCLIDMGRKGEQERFIILHNKDEEETLDSELDGMLHFMPEFVTDKGESVAGNQIIRKLGEVMNNGTNI